MRAAVVEKQGDPPKFAEFPEPIATDGESIVTMSAAAITPLVKSQAAGSHYSSQTVLPLVPGIDGVGRTEDGRRVYALGPRTPFGTMAERTVVASKYLIDVPPPLEDQMAAGIANPGMSSWSALTYRAKLVAGETVFIHGATGVAGRMAIQIAKALGAKRVIAAGRDAAILATLSEIGADQVVSLKDSDDALKAALAGGVDVVLDYLWGSPTERLLKAFTGVGAAEGESRVRFVEIGSAAGPTVSLPGSALRGSGLELIGSGLGSVPRLELLAAISGLFKAAAEGKISAEIQTVPLSDVESAWNLDTGTKRLVISIP